MFKRLVCLLAGTGLVLLSVARAAEPEATGVAVDEWAGQEVMAKSPQVRMYERPDDQSAPVEFSLHGVLLTVVRSEQRWLEVRQGWVHAADVVGVNGAAEHFAKQLAEGESVFAYLGRARGWLKRGDLGRALTDVGESLRLDPKNARSILVRGKIASEQGRHDDALADYDSAVQLDPADTVALEARGYARSVGGDYDAAIRDYDAVIRLMPNNAWVRGARGWCWATKGDLEKAMADLTDAVRLDPHNARGFAVRAVVHLRRRDYDKALADAEQAVHLAPATGYGFAARGAAHAARGELDAALGDFNKAIGLGLFDPQTFADRARVHHLKGDFDASVLDYTQAISLKSDDAQLYFARAEVWSRKGDRASAISDLTEGLRLRPQTIGAYAQRGKLRIEPTAHGAPADPTTLEEALSDFNAALRLDSQHVGALINRAEVWSQQDNLPKAFEDLAAVIEINPNESGAYRQRAGIRMSRREYDLAIEDLTAGIQAEPKKTDCLLDRAVAFALKGEYQKAIDDCHAVLTIEPNNKLAYYHIGMACSWADRNEEALEAYSAVLRIDPDDAGALVSRGNVAAHLGKVDVALADFERLLQFEEHQADAYTSRGQLWLGQRKWEKALADLNEALRLKPNDDFALCHRARCWIGLKQFDKAVQDADEALRLDPKSDFAAALRTFAVQGKDHPSNSADSFLFMTDGNDDGPVDLEPAGPLTTSSYITLQGPAGLELVFEHPSEEFGQPALAVPHRLAMFGNAMQRLKLVPSKADATKALYARLDTGELSHEDAAVLRKSSPSLPLTKEDLDRASSGTDVVKVLVLTHGKSKDEHAGKPQFEVLTSTRTKGGPELVADASRRGVVIAALTLSQHLPQMTPVLRPSFGDRFVRFVLDGPKGLSLSHESSMPGTFDKQPVLVPAQFARLPGIDMRFKLSGPVTPTAEPLYGTLTASLPWPKELGLPGETELPITVTKADLEAAAAGKMVMLVIYLARQTNEEEPSRIETLNSTALPPDSDALAEASRRGKVLAIVKLSKELPAVRDEQVNLQDSESRQRQND
ncbi:MAG TPA: tetratricopeptide repeat protein [Pirellulales bacterium]|nr:tetratricopeptide repeat protein [Pirellulales bacterium]